VARVKSAVVGEAIPTKEEVAFDTYTAADKSPRKTLSA
jgi:hypothetical protein